MADLTLDSQIQYLPGVGPRRAALLANLNIRTVGDLIFYLPFRYDYEPPACPIRELELGQTCTTLGKVMSVRARTGFQKPSITATLIDATGRCIARWFNATWIEKKIAPGATVRVSGVVGEYKNLPQLVNPSLEVLGEDQSERLAAEARLLPVYPATAGLASSHIARLIERALPNVIAQIDEWFDPAFRKARNLPLRRTAVERVHKPLRPEDATIARRRLAYDELFLMQLAILLKRRHARVSVRGLPIVNNELIDQRIRRRFPFKLTAAQNRAVEQIVADLARPVPMNRLLQGDVGSGKTVVALYAALVTVAHRYQVAIMAPTEILAEQHYRNVERYLSGSRVGVALLVGGLGRTERSTAIEQIGEGKIDIVVGTQALLEQDVEFHRLGLVVVDEQHKFGVVQRATIRSKASGGRPHYLIMTATPIPRTLAMTFFGDLDVSVINTLPPGRQPVRTRHIPPAETLQAWAFVRERIDAGEQAYVVYPLVDESEDLPLAAASVEVDRLRSEVFPGRRVELLHGRMKPAEKDRVMHEFAAGTIHVLCATTVIEVGIDVPNATVMVIPHADRFGLSQLHQLRGRIGRGGKAGHCLLMADDPGETARARLGVLVRTSDGFQIAEEDLLLRGPGDLLGGQKQHGFDLRIADLISDVELLGRTRADAAELIAADPRLTDPKHLHLRTALVAAMKGRLELIDVG